MRTWVYVVVALVAVTLAALVAATRLARSAGPPRLAWFYGPPTDGTSARTLARTHDVFVLTYGDEEFREELRDAGYDDDVAQYVTLSRTNGPGGTSAGSDCDEDHAPWRNQVAWFRGDFCEHVHPNEEWFLHNSRGERLYAEIENGYLYAMNPASDGWRAFYRSRIEQAFAGDAAAGPFGYDALFLDEIWGTLHVVESELANSDGAVLEYESDADYERDVMRFVAEVRSAVDVAVWGNANPKLHAEFGDGLDAEMMENFAASWDGEWMSAEEVEESWERIVAAVGSGKRAILVGQGSRDDTSRARYAYAAYLMVAGDDIAFRYHSSDDYRSLWWYPEFDLELGVPEGPRREVAEDVWAREFDGGVAVVNLSGASPQRVRLARAVRLRHGEMADALELGPHEGAVLEWADE